MDKNSFFCDDLEQFRREISVLEQSCFDGHTYFKELTPEQRLEWLAELVVFVYEARSIRINRETAKKQLTDTLCINPGYDGVILRLKSEYSRNTP